MSYSSSSLDREPLVYASLISGLFSIFTAYLCGCFTVVLAIVAITCGTIHLVRRSNASAVDDMWAKCGIGAGVIGFI